MFYEPPGDVTLYRNGDEDGVVIGRVSNGILPLETRITYWASTVLYDASERCQCTIR